MIRTKALADQAFLKLAGPADWDDRINDSRKVLLLVDAVGYAKMCPEARKALDEAQVGTGSLQTDCTRQVRAITCIIAEP